MLLLCCRKLSELRRSGGIANGLGVWYDNSTPERKVDWIVKKTLLIADTDEAFRELMEKLLCEDFHVLCTDNGQQAYQWMQALRPEVTILDLGVKALNGVELLRRLAKEDIHVMVLVTTTHYNERISGELTALGVDDVHLKPCKLLAIADRVRQMAGIGIGMTEAEQMTAYLRELGFNSKWDGQAYLRAAVLAYIRHPGQSLTKVIYDVVAKMYDTDGRSVERSIRNAIENAWKLKNRQEAQRRHFPDGRPTNGDAIAYFADLLKMSKARRIS